MPAHQRELGETMHINTVEGADDFVEQRFPACSVDFYASPHQGHTHNPLEMTAT